MAKVNVRQPLSLRVGGGHGTLRDRDGKCATRPPTSPAPRTWSQSADEGDGLQSVLQLPSPGPCYLPSKSAHEGFPGARSGALENVCRLQYSLGKAHGQDLLQHLYEAIKHFVKQRTSKLSDKIQRITESGQWWGVVGGPGVPPEYDCQWRPHQGGASSIQALGCGYNLTNLKSGTRSASGWEEDKRTELGHSSCTRLSKYLQGR